MMAEKIPTAGHGQTNAAARQSAIILTAFVLFFIAWYYNLAIKPLESFLGNSMALRYFANYVICSMIPAASLWLLHRRRAVVFEQSGLASGFGTGALFAIVCTIPMFVGYAWIGTCNRELTMNHLLTRVVIAGFFEELVFRGFVFGQLFRTARWGFIPAALLTAAAFGSLHLYQGHDLVSALGAFTVTTLGSLFFSWIYVEWNYNLWTVIWLHTLMNLPWILFNVSDSGAVGNFSANALRISTLVLAIILTVLYKKRKSLPYNINIETLIMHKPITCLLAITLLGGCTSRQQTDDRTLYVSILPLKSLVKGIVGDDFDVRVLVPAGASPETFEPAPRQFVGLNRAQMIFNVGLIDFETSLLGKIEAREKIVNLSRDIDLIAGSCSHSGHGRNGGPENMQMNGGEQTHGDRQKPSEEHGNEHVHGTTCPPDCGHAAGITGHNHAHGVDPHVWTSPRALQQMAANAYEAIRKAYPDSTKYAANYARLKRQLEELDQRTAAKIADSGVDYFIIYHPALSYYARDYGLRQVSIEEDGKEPSARQLTRLIRQAREDGIRKIFYQSQFPASSVEVIARDIRARIVEIDPLREDVIANIDRITDSIVSE